MSGLLQAVGWTLIHFCWQATALWVFFCGLDVFLKKATVQTRYLFSLLALLSLLLAPLATLTIELQWPFRLYPQHLLLGSFTGGVAQASIQALLPLLIPWLDALWSIGVVCLGLRSFGGWMYLQKLRRTTLVPAASLRSAFDEVCAKLGLDRAPELGVSQGISTPMTFGYWRPIILLPASALLSLNPDQLQAVFAHELAHVRRADYLWNLLQTSAETLFFFHPVVWWIGRRLHAERELCCDDIALGMCAEPLVYATALFALEERRSPQSSLAMAFHGKQSDTNFKARIQRVLGLPVSPARWSASKTFIGFVISVSALLCLGSRHTAVASGSWRTAAQATRSTQGGSWNSAQRSPRENPQRSFVLGRSKTGDGEVASSKTFRHLNHKTDRADGAPLPHLSLAATTTGPAPHLAGPSAYNEPSPHISAVTATSTPPPHLPSL